MLTLYSLRQVYEAPKDKQQTKLDRLREALRRVFRLEGYFEGLFGYEAPHEDAAFELLQQGDFVVGAEGDEALTVVAYIPQPVLPSAQLLLFDATHGSRQRLVDSVVEFVFESGAHKVTVRQPVNTTQYLPKYGFREVGVLHSETLFKEDWVDMLVYEKLHPAWAHDVGVPLPEVQAAPTGEDTKTNGRNRTRPNAVLNGRRKPVRLPSS